MCLLWAYLAASWNIFTGFAGPLSLGHGIYTAIGAYVTIILFNEFNISPWIGMFVGAGGAVLMSLLIGFPTFKLRAHYALGNSGYWLRGCSIDRKHFYYRQFNCRWC